MKESDFQRLVELSYARKPEDDYDCINSFAGVDKIFIESFDSTREVHDPRVEEKLKGLGKDILQNNELALSQGIGKNDSEIGLRIGVTNYRDIKFMPEVTGEHRRYFGSNSLTLLKDENNRLYVPFFDRNVDIAHYEGVEVESAPKGMHRIDDYEKMDLEGKISRNEDTSSILEEIVRKQAQDQINFPTESKITDISPAGIISIEEPFFEDSAAYIIDVKIPVDLRDQSFDLHTGGKYTGSRVVELSNLANFIENPDGKLMPLARAMVYQLTQKRPDLILNY